MSEQSINPCGRLIEYPHTNIQKINKRLTKFMEGVTITPLVPDPGVDIRDSVCSDYYDNKNLDMASTECLSCISNTSIEDETCPCSMDKLSPCDFAKCVAKEYSTPKKNCNKAFFSLFNLDDINDEKYKPPFFLNDLTCTSGSVSSLNTKTQIREMLDTLGPDNSLHTRAQIHKMLDTLGSDSSVSYNQKNTNIPTETYRYIIWIDVVLLCIIIGSIVYNKMK